MSSPMIEQYDKTKANYTDAILMYQVGDFFEMFRNDALVASKVLDLTLTGKSCDEEDRVPMCGIPIHAVENYIPKLVQAGYKVAISVQKTEPMAGKLVEREVIRVVTPGTITDSIDEKKNNFIASIYATKQKQFGMVYCDITTGEMSALKADSIKTLEDALTRIRPAEIICNSFALDFSRELQGIKLGVLPKFNLYNQIAFNEIRAERNAKKQFSVNNLSVFDIDESNRIIVPALGALVEYLEDTQKRVLTNISKVTIEKPNQFMHLDSNTRKNLELMENMSTKKKTGSLLGLFDKTKTNMGARLIRKFINEPSLNSKVINDRLDGVEELYKNKILTSSLKEVLSKIYDIERISGKIAYGSITPKECITLSESLKSCLSLKNLLDESSAPILKNASKAIFNTGEVITKIDSEINPVPPINLKDGGYIKEGFNKDLDGYRYASTMGKQWLVELENKLKEETNIKTLRVAYNKIFGYYIEVSKSQVPLVPNSWSRRQTTVNGERYINEELKQMEDKILGGVEEALKLEAKIYSELKEYLVKYIPYIQSTAYAVAIVDVLCTMATVALENGYSRPEINDSVDTIEIVDGRHPVVESLLNGDKFIPNDTLLDSNENRTMVITGPNMAGKSTYMRQVAIITLMAHIGSFVPAKSARIAITDRIFTRIGASDDLAFGQSTFMVEMTEVAMILHNATNKSLLVLDEIGRGTSTYDGLSIAWSVLEYLSKHLKAKTLFATHYHELTDLEGRVEGIKNYRILIKELNDSICFLHKIARGSANKSFGIEVAKIAGLPNEITNRAKEILNYQESANDNASKLSFNEEDIIKNSNTKDKINQTEIINILSDIDMNNISPLVAFSTLQNLVDKVKKQ